MDRKNMKYMSSNLERSVETDMNAIAARNKEALNAALIQPLSPEWQFCTNGLYLLLATAGCGKSDVARAVSSSSIS